MNLENIRRRRAKLVEEAKLDLDHRGHVDLSKLSDNDRLLIDEVIAASTASRLPNWKY